MVVTSLLASGARQSVDVALGAVLAAPAVLWALCVGVWQHCRNVWLSRSVPGPRYIPLISPIHIVEEHSTKGIIHLLWKLWKTYGTTLAGFIGPYLLFFSTDPIYVEAVLSSQELIGKSLLYKLVHAWLGAGLLTATGDRWRAHRKALTPAFHFSILEQFLPVMRQSSDVFVRELRRRVASAPPPAPAVDIFPLINLLALDIIAETAMGVKINAQTDGNSSYVFALHEFSDTVARRIMRPWLYPDWIFFRTRTGRRQAAAVKVLHNTSYKVIKDRREELKRMKERGDSIDTAVDAFGRKRRLAFLDLLVLAAENGSGFSDTDIREEVDTFMFEGLDTTASALAFTLYLLSQHQDVQEKVLQELEEVFEGRAPDPSPAHLARLRYTEMVLKESLRLYPPVPALGRAVHSDFPLPQGGFAHGLRALPSGSEAIVSPLLQHRDPALFPDPEAFKPERFEAEAARGRHPFAYIPFSAGPRNCIGQKYAMMEMKCIVSKTVWHFRLLPEPGFEPELSYEMVLKSDNGVLVRVEDRQRPVAHLDAEPNSAIPAASSAAGRATGRAA